MTHASPVDGDGPRGRWLLCSRQGTSLRVRTAAPVGNLGASLSSRIEMLLDGLDEGLQFSSQSIPGVRNLARQ